MTDSDKAQTACKVTEITPAMIEAGVSEMRDSCYGRELGELVESVYLAVEIERRSHFAKSLASSNTVLK